MLGKKKQTHHHHKQPFMFEDTKAMHDYLQNKLKQMQNETKSRLKDYAKQINIIINKLYNEISTTAFELDRYRIPIHGIQYPTLENPMNLF